MQYRFSTYILVLLSSITASCAFVPTRSGKFARVLTDVDSSFDFGRQRFSLHASVADGEKSFVLSDEEVGPAIRLAIGSNGNDKIINAFGLWAVVVSLITCPIWSLAMMVMDKLESDPTRSTYDFTGKIWSRVWLAMTGSTPEVFNLERINESVKHETGVLFVANHASWLDIPVLCTALDPVFKFISKGDLIKAPCIGQQLKGGNHILIEREDRRSQLRTFKEGINWLKSGVSVMAFPEGQRSPDGRLIKFKGGSFAMAAKSGATIVPITIANTHAVMPMNALFPVQSGAGKLQIHVHEPINPEGKTDEELNTLVRNAIISKLPWDQRPLPNEEDRSSVEIKESVLTN